MAKKVYNMQGGKHSAAALSAFLNAMYGTSVASGLNGVITGTTGLNTIVKAGAGNINDSGVGRMIEIDADETVSHAAASASNPRNDLVVAYIDKGVTPTTSVVDNVNDILKFKAVTGNPSSSPIDPIASEIQASVGASNPYMVLYRVRIDANATSLTQTKITNLRQTALLKNRPIGSIYISVDSTDPSTIFGGVWVQFAKGMTIVGVDTAQTEFNTVEKTGGAKTHTLTVDQMPPHAHTLDTSRQTVVAGSGYSHLGSNGSWNFAALEGASGTTTAGSGAAHNNLQPYITTYMWKRTA